MKWKAVRYWGFILGADALAVFLLPPNTPWFEWALLAWGVWYLAGQIMERP